MSAVQPQSKTESRAQINEFIPSRIFPSQQLAVKTTKHSHTRLNFQGRASSRYKSRHAHLNCAKKHQVTHCLNQRKKIPSARSIRGKKNSKDFSYYQNALTFSLTQVQRLRDCKKTRHCVRPMQPHALNLHDVACVSTVLYLATYHCMHSTQCFSAAQRHVYSTYFVRLCFNLSQPLRSICGALPRVVGKTT